MVVVFKSFALHDSEKRSRERSETLGMYRTTELYALALSRRCCFLRKYHTPSRSHVAVTLPLRRLVDPGIMFQTSSFIQY